MKYRKLEKSDLENVLQFWGKHYKVSKRDTVERLETFLGKNEGFSTIALDDTGTIYGTVLASYDGRKGYIQKMVIRNDTRGKGYGQELLHKTIRKLKDKGVLDIRVSCNEKTAPFYEKCGFSRKPIVTLQIKYY